MSKYRNREGMLMKKPASVGMTLGTNLMLAAIGPENCVHCGSADPSGAAGNTNFACDFLSKNYSCTNLHYIKEFSRTMGLFNFT